MVDGMLLHACFFVNGLLKKSLHLFFFFFFFFFLHLQTYGTVQLLRCFQRTRICALRMVARRGLFLLASHLRVTHESLANFAQSCAIISQMHLSNARRESDMRDLYNLNNLAR